MKTILFVLIICLIQATNTLSADSTRIMPATNIDNSSVIPVGTVITWNSFVYPDGWSSDVNNTDWLECNGQPIPFKYEKLRQLDGNNVPDYQGVFLRGFGGGSAPLNVLQDSAAHVQSSEKVTLSVKDVSRGYHLAMRWKDDHGLTSGGSDISGREEVSPFRAARYNTDNRFVTINGGLSTIEGKAPIYSSHAEPHSQVGNRYKEATDYAYPNTLGFDPSGSISLPVHIESKASETRPDNLSVKYFIRTR